MGEAAGGKHPPHGATLLRFRPLVLVLLLLPENKSRPEADADGQQVRSPLAPDGLNVAAGNRSMLCNSSL